MGFGAGNMHDFIGPASFRGFTVDYRNLVKPNIGVGVDIGWNVFYDEMPDGVYEYKNITIFRQTMALQQPFSYAGCH